MTQEVAPRPSALKKRPGAATATGATAKASPKQDPKEKFPLLDRGVVQASLQAGIPESQLMEMQRLIGSH